MHKCKFVAYRRQRARSKRSMSYKCHGCFRIMVVKKRLLRRALTRSTYRGWFVIHEYYDLFDPRYQNQVITEEESFRELFSYESNH